MVSSMSSGSHIPSDSTYVGFPATWEEQFDRDILFRDECYKVYQLFYIETFEVIKIKETNTTLFLFYIDAEI